ncbi:hypothetical protein OIE67_10710 [Nonomuraea fuscirosea]|uniref:hypothetical protein n=1 Tax=Nonomuraea fuscirosea TaxID=1291556 RepID=UPI002DD8D31B|nr:hypothetical protein [Nonomuraea fuscirosea]WSA55054.1 hypothetical protein OIE67_10710 [Nonomuraea fuscirosea]
MLEDLFHQPGPRVGRLARRPGAAQLLRQAAGIQHGHGGEEGARHGGVLRGALVEPVAGQVQHADQPPGGGVGPVAGARPHRLLGFGQRRGIPDQLGIRGLLEPLDAGGQRLGRIGH